MLSALQRRVAGILTKLPEAEGFALAGGAALILYGEVDRLTRDLDFFCVDRDGIDRLIPPLEAAFSEADLAFERVKFSESFIRLMVSDGIETTELDLAIDARMMPPQTTELGPVLSVEELAADKTLALFDRARPRDFVDFLSLEQRFGIQRLCQLAREKDPGFRAGRLLESVLAFNRFPRDEFDVSDSDFARLRVAIPNWESALRQLTTSPPGN